VRLFVEIDQHAPQVVAECARSCWALKKMSYFARGRGVLDGHKPRLACLPQRFN
jgi:hypothetical protein